MVRFQPGAEHGAGVPITTWRSFVRRQSAWRLEQEGDLDGAQRVLSDAFAESPADLDAVLDLCGLLLRRGRGGDALRLLALAERRAPDEADRLAARLAELHAELGDPRVAACWYARALDRVVDPARELVVDRLTELTALVEGRGSDRAETVGNAQRGAYRYPPDTTSTEPVT